MESSSDFIMDFISWTKESIRDTPDSFRRWCAISMIASALERRVWVQVGGYSAFPNMYIMLIAPSGHGKYLIDYAKGILREVKQPGTRNPAFRIAPDNMTKASLIDELAKAEVCFIPPAGSPVMYHALNVYSEDINAWMAQYDPETFGALLYIWNNPDVYHETRRTSISKEKNITRPLLNLLVGIQPFIMGTLFPDEAWYTGFTRRTLMVYSYEPQEKKRLSEFVKPDTERREEFLLRLGKLSRMYGEFTFTPEAYSQLVEWDFSGGHPQPKHSKLEAYLKSRTIFVEKLAMISSASRGMSKRIDEEDLSRAVFWLLDAEATMPDIFRAMRGKSDGSVLEELWRWMGREFAGRGKSVPRKDIVSYLSNKVTHEKVERIISLAEQADFIRRMSGTIEDYIPGPKGPGEF